jgi:DNA gyrase subunit B
MAFYLLVLLHLLVCVAGFRWSTLHRRYYTFLHSTTTSPTEEASSVNSQVNTAYDADAIIVLEGLEPVRKRPGMYIGSTGQRGLHHLVFEVVDNSVDESLAGHCTKISVTLLEDGSVEVVDNGRGIPCSIHPKTGKSALETVLCVLHAGGKFGGDDSGYKVSGGLHGVGVSVVNALSEKLTVEVCRDGSMHNMEFSRGIPVSPLRISSVTNQSRGTKVTFKPDPSIFKTTIEFEFDKLSSRMDELAYLNAGLTIELIDKRSINARLNKVKIIDIDGEDNEKIVSSDTISTSTLIPDNPTTELAPRIEVYKHDGGIKELIQVLCDDKTNIHPEVGVITIKEERKGVAIEVAMQWSKEQYTDALTGFANGIRTPDGGSHLDGLKQAVTKTINQSARKIGKLKEGVPSIPGDFIREGLTAVVSVKVAEPEFEGQTKQRLGNPEVRQIVDSIVSDALTYIFDFNPQVLSAICQKAIDAQNAALAAKAARDMVRRKSLLTSTVLPGKLADCSSRTPSECEIYIVEGDSAAGSAKLGRDRRTQAILPLRGKILNIEKASTDTIYQNKEIQNLISALGLGTRGADFDVEQLRYHRIVIMTDADVDGAHIRLLLLTFFYRYQRDLIRNGYVYIACPPLYKVTTKGKNGDEKYLYDQNAMDSYMKTLPVGSNPQIQRFKGLGEMMPNQLWSTTMDPSSRTLKQVSVEDAASADRMFGVLMGDNVQPRKDFITANADLLKLEDLDF